MTDTAVDVRIDDDIAVLTLNRPDRLNALDINTRVLLAQGIRRLGTGDEVRGIVLTGSGRAFSAGEDLAAIPTTSDGIREAFATF
ncbi:MAG: enoyl-CoA hydratase/isomerase family protein, partial [Gordonia sp. (in: high G+C Gram-positive bacteria)]|nr:enoyl-CoA hydratase/isomerase family protein [Gordonia sp. (in: high G+C Gram-positive bacteria)]